MYLIDRDQNRIQALQPSTLSSLGFQERPNVQEWIAALPSSLGEDLLIIQKEFDGFDDTRERLDLLAIDKQGRLVIIENKLDDSGKDVTWQAIKYAAYCSSLAREDVVRIAQDFFDEELPGRDAVAVISDFLGVENLEGVQINEGASQRVFMIATHLRKEVTATALWLANFGLDVRCFKLSPFTLGTQLFLTIEQVIPVPEAQDFMIGVSRKMKEEEQTRSARTRSDGLKKDFWVAVLQGLSERGVRTFEKTKATERQFISKATGLQATSYELVIGKSEARMSLYINTGDSGRSDQIFDFLLAQKSTIETSFEGKLTWDRNEGKNTTQVLCTRLADYKDEQSWDEIIAWMAATFASFKKAFDPAIRKAKKDLSEADRVALTAPPE